MSVTLRWTPDDMRRIARTMDYQPDDEKAPEEIWLTLDETELAAARANEINANEEEAKHVIYNIFDARVKKEIEERMVP